ncbi:MAG: hypothetical protein HYX63_01055 [Gammaproteobacteria bacterium]|nr:hypothetical protein [Gammaproteobacteria bacterium]
MSVRFSCYPRLISALWLIAAALLSIVYQGWDFGLNNNASHLAIIDQFRDPALFPGNPFIAALHNYCTVLWWVIKRIPMLSNLPLTFFVVHIATRLITLYAIVLLLEGFVRDRIFALAGATVLGFSGALQSFTPISRSDLLITYTNQSAVAMALVLLAYAYLLRRRDTLAMVVCGLALNCNVFMGLWAAAVITIYRVALRQIRRPADVAAFCLPIGAFLVAGLPVVAWVASILLSSQPTISATDYGQFLYDFYPFHYYIAASPPSAIATHVVTVIAGVLAILALRTDETEAAVLYTAHLGLFALGIAMPFMTTGKIFMDLQLMRIETFVDILAFVLVIAAAGSRWSHARESTEFRLLILLAAIGAVLGYWVIVVIGLVSALRHTPPYSKNAWWAPALVVCVGLLIGVSGVELPELWSPRLQRLIVCGILFYCTVSTRLPIASFFPALATLNYADLNELEGLVILLLAPCVARADDSFERLIRYGMQATALIIVCAASVALLYNASPEVVPAWFDSILVPRDGSRLHFAELCAVSLLALLVGINRGVPRLSGALENRQVGRHGHRAALIGLLLLILPTSLSVALHRWTRQTLSNRDAEVRELPAVGQWIAANTKINEEFFVAFKYDEFSVFAKRNYWWGMKYGDGVVCNPSLYPEYRMRKELQSRFQRRLLDDQATEFWAFTKTHGISYVLAENAYVGHGTAFKIVHATPHYSVLRLSERVAGQASSR